MALEHVQPLHLLAAGRQNINTPWGPDYPRPTAGFYIRGPTCPAKHPASQNREQLAAAPSTAILAVHLLIFRAVILITPAHVLVVVVLPLLIVICLVFVVALEAVVVVKVRQRLDLRLVARVGEGLDDALK